MIKKRRMSFEQAHRLLEVRIPVMPDGYSNLKPDRYSNLMPATIPI